MAYFRVGHVLEKLSTAHNPYAVESQSQSVVVKDESLQNYSNSQLSISKKSHPSPAPHEVGSAKL